jgi:4,4'-diaponeurosporenoate glycosyltransferase
MLWRLRPLPWASERSIAVAAIVPARNEAEIIGGLIEALVAQARPDDEVVVVDDHSSDATAVIAAAAGARVLHAGDFDDSWLGKPHACHIAALATTAPLLVFIDADVQPPGNLLDRLAATTGDGELVTVQPWHRTERSYEQGSLLPNIVALMGCAAFSPLGQGAAATVAFGPVIAVRRGTYTSSGGHAHPQVRNAGLEDVALARVVGRTRIFSGAPDIAVRLHPRGWREMSRGWTRSISAGFTSTPWWAALAVTAWVWSVAGGWLAWPWAYPLTAAQLVVLGRRAGNFNVLASLLFPLASLAFVLLMVRSLAVRISRRTVGWKGRPVQNRR